MVAKFKAGSSSGALLGQLVRFAEKAPLLYEANGEHYIASGNLVVSGYAPELELMANKRSIVSETNGVHQAIEAMNGRLIESSNNSLRYSDSAGFSWKNPDRPSITSNYNPTMVHKGNGEIFCVSSNLSTNATAYISSDNGLSFAARGGTALAPAGGIYKILKYYNGQIYGLCSNGGGSAAARTGKIIRSGDDLLSLTSIGTSSSGSVIDSMTEPRSLLIDSLGRGVALFDGGSNRYILISSDVENVPFTIFDMGVVAGGFIKAIETGAGILISTSSNLIFTDNFFSTVANHSFASLNVPAGVVIVDEHNDQLILCPNSTGNKFYRSGDLTGLSGWEPYDDFNLIAKRPINNTHQNDVLGLTSDNHLMFKSSTSELVVAPFGVGTAEPGYHLRYK